jgi:epoxyqueuosine reductase
MRSFLSIGPAPVCWANTSFEGGGKMTQTIQDKARELGYEKCGIIKIGDVADYSVKLKERMSRVFLGPIQFSQFKGLANPPFPWAKSIIILSGSITGYNIPDGFDGMYGKAFMFDGRIDKNSPDFKKSQEFKAFLESEGIKCEEEPKFGITALRWAAHKAGIGLIRKNNFFYSKDSGSYCFLSAWLIDRELELKGEPDLKECPDSCDRCIKACPTGSLNKPYTMSLIKCAAFISTLSAAKGMGNTPVRTAKKLGRIVYGCDICQDVCPFNNGKHTGGEDFPGLAEISEFMRPEKIMPMTYEEINSALASKYWYVADMWKWKLNALSYMLNNWDVRYTEFVNLGLNDSDKRVRAFAGKVKKIRL